jgi:hypothetical protein
LILQMKFTKHTIKRKMGNINQTDVNSGRSMAINQKIINSRAELNVLKQKLADFKQKLQEAPLDQKNLFNN